MKTKNPIAAARGLRLVRGALLAALATLSLAAVADQAQLDLGKKLFSQGAVPACSVCHTLQASKAEGAVGPSLDELQPDAARVVKALRDGIGQMPSYKGRLTEAQMQALGMYVAKASGAAK